MRFLPEVHEIITAALRIASSPHADAPRGRIPAPPDGHPDCRPQPRPRGFRGRRGRSRLRHSPWRSRTRGRPGRDAACHGLPQSHKAYGGQRTARAYFMGPPPWCGHLSIRSIHPAFLMRNPLRQQAAIISCDHARERASDPNAATTAVIRNIIIMATKAQEEPPRSRVGRGAAGEEVPAMTDFRARGTIMGPAGLTAVFGMGTGVAPPVWSPGNRPAGGQATPAASVRSTAVGRSRRRIPIAGSASAVVAASDLSPDACRGVGHVREALATPAPARLAGGRGGGVGVVKPLGC